MTAAPTYTLTIPDWLPCRLNKLLGCHFMTAHRRKREDKHVVALYALADGIPKAQGKRRVTLALTLTKGMRRPDVDAHWKGLLDSLVACGLLIDDGPKWCEITPVEYDRGPRKKTVVTLEDLP